MAATSSAASAEKTDSSRAASPFSAPQISLPKGGGAIHGIGEKFAMNPVTGTASFSVPIFASPGRSGFGPKLTLSYDSGAGNGPFGLGWHLAIPSITRKTSKGLPQYQDQQESDVFLISDAEDLVPELVSEGAGCGAIGRGLKVFLRVSRNGGALPRARHIGAPFPATTLPASMDAHLNPESLIRKPPTGSSNGCWNAPGTIKAMQLSTNTSRKNYHWAGAAWRIVIAPIPMPRRTFIWSRFSMGTESPA